MTIVFGSLPWTCTCDKTTQTTQTTQFICLQICLFSHVPCLSDGLFLLRGTKIKIWEACQASPLTSTQSLISANFISYILLKSSFHSLELPLALDVSCLNFCNIVLTGLLNQVLIFLLNPSSTPLHQRDLSTAQISLGHTLSKILHHLASASFSIVFIPSLKGFNRILNIMISEPFSLTMTEHLRLV